ncbi:phosphate ABC transporter substrate-binding/OmpA family protein [Yoonia sp. 2307UL14-13]|uniref:phosphate ABC transporter substrate-binding/OmpA family protein n=1 Tax=Yoonia sp. 2307UL14-13 TaxID=3126506 RepID=UPI003094F749
MTQISPRKRTLFLTSAMSLLVAMPAYAQSIVDDATLGNVLELRETSLVQKDGSASLTGKLLSLDNGFFTLFTEAGDIVRVPVDDVICKGADCPQGTTWAVAPASAEETVETPEEEIVDVAALKANAALRFTGSDTVGLVLMPSMLEDYAAVLDADIQNSVLPDLQTFVRYVDVDANEITTMFVDSGGDAKGFAELADSAVDFGMTSRRPDNAENRRIVGNGDLRGSDNETVIGIDSLAAVLHPDNPIQALSLEQLRAIYAGEITNWSQVGGNDAPITVLSRAAGVEKETFENVIFSGEGADLGANVTFVETANVDMAANVDVSDRVRNDPNAIGYVSLVFAKDLKSVGISSSCGITSTANTFDIKTEQYPLVRRLYLYNRAESLSTEAQDFLEYALSPAVDDAIDRSGLVNFAVERQPQAASPLDRAFGRNPSAAESGLADQLSGDKAQWDRLSTTVRFPTGVSAIGNKELNDIARLIEYLEGLPEGASIAIVGFADDVGDFGSNLRLSERRAQSVTQQITELAGSRLDNVSIETRAYSELAPLVCNSDANNRAINRRVEVWVRK